MLVLTTECNMQLHLKEGLPVSLKVKDEGKVKFTPTIVRCAPFYQVLLANMNVSIIGN
eukprot:m.183315 g.183315  ORF g.183315 m.183315 type:complete len:58 (+) comp13592_c0_seq21:4358-4531(+)